MERALGIGGFFFCAKDPQRLWVWYADNFGINLPPQSYDAKPWLTEAGITIFSPMEKNSELFGKSGSQWAMNFRVGDLEAFVAQLRNSGIDVEIDQQNYPNGRFAMLKDPEGNVIQLWQPALANAPD